MLEEEQEDNELLIAKQCVELAEAKYGGQSDQLIEALIQVAVTLHDRAAYLESLGAYIRARTILEGREDLLHPRMADILVGIGEHYLVQDMPIEARPYYEKALSIRNALFIDENTDTAHIHTKVGEIMCIQGEYDEARENLFRALQIYTSQAPDQDEEIGDVLHNIGLLLVSEAQFDRAVDYLKKAIVHREKAFGAESPEVEESRRILKHSCESLGIQYEEPKRQENRRESAPPQPSIEASPQPGIINLMPESSGVLRGLLESALVALNQNSFEAAKEILRVAHKITSGEDQARDQIGSLLSKIENKISAG